jgi:hypothetical protein
MRGISPGSVNDYKPFIFVWKNWQLFRTKKEFRTSFLFITKAHQIFLLISPEKFPRKTPGKFCFASAGHPHPLLSFGPGTSYRPFDHLVKVKVQGPFFTQFAALRHFKIPDVRFGNPGILRAKIRAHCIVFSRIRYFSGPGKKGPG